MNDICANNFIKDLSMYVFNINWTLKNIKSSIMADYICTDSKEIIIATNKIAFSSDLQAIEKYVKNTSSIETDQVQSSRLPQSKSYLKIIDIPYLSEATNTCITSDNVKRIPKNNYIFNNVILVLKPRIIKMSPKLDIVII